MRSKGKSITLILLSLLIIGFIGYRSYLKRNPYDRSVDENKDIVDAIEATVTSGPIKKISQYYGNSLKNGSSPFDNLYGKGIYTSTKNQLIVKNQGNSDLVLFLISKQNNKVIRNEYIRAHSSFDLTQIPNFPCYVKCYYGKDWNPTRKTKGITTGGFETDEQYVVSDNPGDILYFQEEVQGDYVYYSSYELTLETTMVEGTSMSQENVKASAFF